MINEFIFNHKVYAIKKGINFSVSDAVNEEIVHFRTLDSAQSFFRSITNDKLACEDLLRIAKRHGVSNSENGSQTPLAVFEKLCLKVYYGDLLLVEIKPVEVKNTMGTVEKEKCAEIFEIYTGVNTPVDKWNEAAATLLAEMIDNIENCSTGMGAAKAIWPSTSKVSWLWLLKIPYKLIKNKNKIRNGYINKTCLNAAITSYQSLIEAELIN